MTGQVFSHEQINQCLQTLDDLARSGLSPQAFAQERSLDYKRLRAWRTQEARWRARLAGQVTAKPVASAIGFVPVKAASTTSHASTSADTHSIRIECCQGKRSAVVHWPLHHGTQCAQWLAAYLA